MQLADLLELGERELQCAKVAEYQLEARLLLEYCTGKTRTEIFLHGSEHAGPETRKRYMELLARRAKREPLAYIQGEQEFWSLPFWVTPDVLIPRPETEFLLDRVLALTTEENFQYGHLLDLCCGSGVIATILAKETGKRIIASDISLKALKVTGRNTKRHRCEKLVLRLRGDLFSPFAMRRCFSLIVSNPPYVSSFDVRNNLLPEVEGYEPHLALDGGEKGLDLIRRIRAELPRMLSPGGQYFMEIGADQGGAVKEMFEKNMAGLTDFQQVEILRDYSGRDRVLHARLLK